MNISLKGFKASWVFLFLLLIGSVSFPATREAHVLILRLVFHLAGTTVVQGQLAGCVIYPIPNVQFTDNFTKELRAHSKNSLDDHALAMATGNYRELEQPRAEDSWTNHPLLGWEALHTPWLVGEQLIALNATNIPITNPLALASLKNARTTIHLAQTMAPTNGALWLAEALIDFTESRDEAALAALDYAASNRNWSVNSAISFAYLNELYMKAGLSKLEAAYTAQNNAADVFSWNLLGKNRQNLERLMTAAVTTQHDQDFSRCLQLLVELRRAEWADKSRGIYNLFRGFQASDELIEAMANQMGKPLISTNKDLQYPERRVISESVFRDYIWQHSDRETVACFVTQAEGHKTERKLRSQLSEVQDKAAMWRWLGCILSGPLTALLFSLLIIALLFEPVIGALRKSAADLGKIPRTAKFRWLSAVVVFAGAGVIANFWTAIGGGNRVGFGPVEPPPIINPLLQTWFVAVIFCSVLLGGLHLDWKSKKPVIKPWNITGVFVVAYLVGIVVMAYFRSEVVDIITANIV